MKMAMVDGKQFNGDIDDFLQDLHWLKVKFRIDLKILVQMFNAEHGVAPEYICNAVKVIQQSRLTRSYQGFKL